MKKIILKFGLISGVLCSAMMLITIPFEDKIGFGHSLIVGYTTIVASFLLVYFGIRSYRNHVGGGHITFGRAFAVGISITLVTCIFYVVTWEVMYFYFMPDFLVKYDAYVIAKARAAGATEAAIQAKTLELQKSAAAYNNPLVNMAMTFIEPFPVGLLITVISAAVLRRKDAPQSATSALPASS
ncbi:MAG TPA: DUF4199 domain-containing protein [Terracidiphilus sp.]|jgi:uncharacterized membrane protein